MDQLPSLMFLVDYPWFQGFGPAFTASFFVILATEIGDRTFFIAAIMAMHHPRFIVWSAAVSALVLMTFISCVFGMTAIAFIDKIYVHWAVIGLMFFFGIQMIRSGLSKPKSAAGFEEMEEVETETFKNENKQDVETNAKLEVGYKSLTTVALQAFTLTFLAEWGDRSQLATIALAAANSPLGVMLGGVTGHMMCTGIAVIGGRLIANYVSERTVTLTGGALFLGFGVYAALMGP